MSCVRWKSPRELPQPKILFYFYLKDMLHDCCWVGRIEELKKMATSPKNSTTLFWQEWWLKKAHYKNCHHPPMHEIFQQFFFQMHMTLTWMKIFVLDFLSTITTHTHWHVLTPLTSQILYQLLCNASECPKCFECLPHGPMFFSHAQDF
jgi:hypothetical protein